MLSERRPEALGRRGRQVSLKWTRRVSTSRCYGRPTGRGSVVSGECRKKWPGMTVLGFPSSGEVILALDKWPEMTVLGLLSSAELKMHVSLCTLDCTFNHVGQL